MVMAGAFSPSLVHSQGLRHLALGQLAPNKVLLSALPTMSTICGASFRTSSLLPLVFAFAHPLQDSETCLFRVGNGKGLGRIESRPDPAYWFLARRTMCQWLGIQRATQCEPPTANLAVAFTEFVFVEWHDRNLDALSAPVKETYSCSARSVNVSARHPLGWKPLYSYHHCSDQAKA